VASSVSLGFPLYCDGMTWSSLLQRSFMGGAAAWDTNASASAVNPLGGVFGGLGNPLQVTQAGTPNMTVLVNAGYCAVPNATQGHGVYLFGQTAQGTLTVASNTSGSTRVDIIVAGVSDTGNSSSYCFVEIVEGTPGSGQPATPSASILLAAVTVASGASSITNSNITDKRAFTAAPGGILPAAAAALPASAPGQVAYNTTTGTLQRPNGSGGWTGLASGSAGISDVNTDTGTGLTPGNGSRYGWGIGYGSQGYGGWWFFGTYDADGQITDQIQEQFTADGATDFAIDAKWGLAVPEAAADGSSPSITNGQCRILLLLDGTILDSVCLRCAASGGTAQPGDAGSFTYYTSAILGTTPAAGTHTAVLAVQTQHTLSGTLSGAHVGDLASVGTSGAFGTLPAGFLSALTQENCYLRVAAVSASTP